MTAITLACQSNNLAVVATLLEAGANPNVWNKVALFMLWFLMHYYLSFHCRLDRHH